MNGDGDRGLNCAGCLVGGQDDQENQRETDR
jgi:hypothetical protein